MVRRLACLKESGSYTGGGLAPGRFNKAVQVPEEGQHKTQSLVLQVGCGANNSTP